MFLERSCLKNIEVKKTIYFIYMFNTGKARLLKHGLWKKFETFKTFKEKNYR